MSLADTFYAAILEMRGTNSTNKKETILQKHRSSPTFKRILYQTYSPYIRYHIRAIPKKFIGRGVGELDETTWRLLSKLSLRKITGNVARETLFEHLEGLSPSAEKILRLIIKKDLKCGVAATTINKTFPDLIPVFDCQLVDDWDDNKARYPMLIGPKIDCVRGEFRGNAFYTRRGHKITGINHIVKYINSAGRHLMLSGELYIPGMSFARASGIIRSNKAKKPNVKFACFDIPSLGDLPYADKHDFIAKTFYPLGTKPHPPVVYIPHVSVDSKDAAVVLFKKWRNMGWEGLVGKNPNGTTKVGKGSYDWMRMVGGVEAEYKIINVYESNEMPNMLGGVVIEGNIKVGSGFCDDERKKYWADPSIILGRLATIIAKEKTKAGSLRQPIYKGIRWDI